MFNVNLRKQNRAKIFSLEHDLNKLLCHFLIRPDKISIECMFDKSIPCLMDPNFTNLVHVLQIQSNPIQFNRVPILQYAWSNSESHNACVIVRSMTRDYQMSHLKYSVLLKMTLDHEHPVKTKQLHEPFSAIFNMYEVV